MTPPHVKDFYRGNAISPKLTDLGSCDVSGEGQPQVEREADDVAALGHRDDQLLAAFVDPERGPGKNLRNVNLNGTVDLEDVLEGSRPRF